MARIFLMEFTTFGSPAASSWPKANLRLSLCALGVTPFVVAISMSTWQKIFGEEKNTFFTIHYHSHQVEPWKLSFRVAAVGWRLSFLEAVCWGDSTFWNVIFTRVLGRVDLSVLQAADAAVARHVGQSPVLSLAAPSLARWKLFSIRISAHPAWQELQSYLLWIATRLKRTLYLPAVNDLLSSGASLSSWSGSKLNWDGKHYFTVCGLSHDDCQGKPGKCENADLALTILGF